MASIWSKRLSGEDGNKNIHVQVNGYLEAGDQFLEWSPIASPPDGKLFRVDILDFAVSDKVEVLLAWNNPGGKEYHVFLPLIGRGRLDFDHVQGLRCTTDRPGSGGILVMARALEDAPFHRYFTLAIDLTTQRGA